MKLNDLFEVFDTSSKLEWVKETSTRYVADFDIEAEQFYVQLDVFIDDGFKFCFVLFGKYDEHGKGSTRRVASKRQFKVLSIVINGVVDLVTKLNLEIAVYTAKDLDRQSSYASIGQRLAKELNFKYESRIKGQVGVYILSKEDLTSEQSKFLVTRMKEEIPKK